MNFSLIFRIDDFPNFIGKIAKKVAKIHACDIDELDKSPTLFETLIQWATTARGIREREMSRELREPGSPEQDQPSSNPFTKFQQEQAHQRAQQQRRLWESLDVDLILREVLDMRSRLEKPSAGTFAGTVANVTSPIVFCHNDLNAGNMLLDSKSNIVIIDYEYGSYNYRGFDLGNFFCEWMMNYRVKDYPNFKVNLVVDFVDSILSFSFLIYF